MRLTLLSLLSLLPTALSFPPPPTNFPSIQCWGYPNDWIAIHQTLHRYPLAVDTKQFSLLSSVFTPTASADYGPPLGVLSGLPTIEATLQAALAPVTSQHKLSTTVIDIASNGTTANSTTYFEVHQFGTGVYVGEYLQDFGKYEDVLVKNVSDSSGGCGGTWRIQQRTLVYIGIFIGNTSIFNPQ